MWLYICDSVRRESWIFSDRELFLGIWTAREKLTSKSEKHSPKLASILIKSLLYEVCKARDLLPLELRFSQRPPNLPTYTLSPIIFGELWYDNPWERWNDSCGKIIPQEKIEELHGWQIMHVCVRARARRRVCNFSHWKLRLHRHIYSNLRKGRKFLAVSRILSYES